MSAWEPPAIPRLRETAPGTQIVVLTMQNDPAFAREALRAGAIGYVLKEAADSELVQAVRLAAQRSHVPQPRAGSASGRRTAGGRGRPTICQRASWKCSG